MKPNTGYPPEYRLLQLCTERCGSDFFEFQRLCSLSEYRGKDEPSALVTFLKEKFGREWFMELFRFAEPEFRVTVIESSSDASLADLFKKRRLGRYNIKKLAEAYCDWAAALFADPAFLADQSEATD